MLNSATINSMFGPENTVVQELQAAGLSLKTARHLSRGGGYSSVGLTAQSERYVAPATRVETAVAFGMQAIAKARVTFSEVTDRSL